MKDDNGMEPEVGREPAVRFLIGGSFEFCCIVMCCFTMGRPSECVTG